MKKLILICTLLIGLVTYSQEKYAISIVQDPSLAFTKDDHGNVPFTLDVVLKGERQMNQEKYGYGSLYAQIEFADLSAGFYTRYSSGFAYSFNQFSELFSITPSVNIGMIRRWQKNYYSGEFQLEGAYHLSKRLDLICLFSKTNRSDIDVYRFNAYLGFKYNL